MKLCEVLRQYRWATKIGSREMAAEIGISGSTLVRIERGEVPHGSTMAKVLRWLLKERDEAESTSSAGEEPASGGAA